jgi:hypothetical protein
MISRKSLTLGTGVIALRPLTDILLQRFLRWKRGIRGIEMKTTSIECRDDSLPGDEGGRGVSESELKVEETFDKS